ncbi:MAG: extracellular solute-binding protein, partial [Candidatus Eisenbacteria bacterium]|nr:extracellular solute-binding protein [Candidatus Eisenbacteria bacterium]
AWQLTKDIDDRMTTTPSARIALALVEKKAADAGFVYESDALRSDQVRVDLVIDPKYHEEIRYTGSIVSRSTQKENAKKFLDLLLSEPGQETLKNHGFRSAKSLGNP